MCISSFVFGRQGYLSKEIVAHNQAKFQHATAFGWREMHFEFDAYHIILTGASDLKLFVGGVNPDISRDTRIKIFTTRNMIWLMKQKIIVTKFDSATNQPRFLSMDEQGLGQSDKTLHFSHGRSWIRIWYLTYWTYYPCDRFTIAATTETERERHGL